MKKYNSIRMFLFLLIRINISFAEEKFKPYSNLLTPQNGSIIDIGKKDNTPSPNVTKILKEIPASVRIFDNNFILAERNINRYSCYADQNGYEACSVGLQACTHSIDYIPGLSTEHHIHEERPKERVTATKEDREDDTFYANWMIKPNHGSIDGSKISVVDDHVYSAHDNFPSASELYKQGWKTPDGKFAMKIFNYGSGCGGMSVYPLPDHVQVIANGGSKVKLQGYNSSCDQLISSGNGQYATVLLTWDQIPTESIKFECDDYCLAGKPTSPVGYWKWGCNAPWVFKDDKCYLDYYYYTYTCPVDERTGKPLPILVDTGSDCGGFCGGYGCKCNSKNPPPNNCSENVYTCPYGDDIPCADVTTPNNVTSNTNNELGYTYALGNSIEHENNLTKIPSCPNQGTFNDRKGICVANSDTANCPAGSTLLNGKCVVDANCPGVIVNGKCEIKPNIQCNDSNARYYETYRGCAINKGCSIGTLNPITGMCESDPQPPSGWRYDRTINQFVKEPLITTDPICNDPALSWNGNGRCVGSPDFTQWTIGNDKYGVTGVTGSLTVNSDSIVENRNTPYAAWFVSPISISQGEFSGTIQIGSRTTLDSVGLLFGFQGANNYYVFDWSNPKSHWGGINNGDNAAIVNITDPNYVSGVQISSDYEVVGNGNSWSENNTYDISVRFRDDKAEVFVNGNEILNANGLDMNKLKTGKIGFWEYSIQNVTYSNFTIQTKPTCPSGYIYMDGYDICVYNEGNNVTIDAPNNRYLKPVSCSIGVLNPNTGKCETSSSCGGQYPYEDTNTNKCYGLNNYIATCPDTTHWLLVDSNDISGYNKVCQSTSVCTNGYTDTVINGHLYCAQDPQRSCPVGYTYSKTDHQCYADPVCTDGYVYDENLKRCVIHYKWYEYTCPTDYEGPIVSKGKDCQGHCGYDGCSCNMKTPPANNCRKQITDNTTYDLFEKRNMIVHQILNPGNFNEKEFGVVKRFACNENPDQTCSFDVTKIWGDGDKLCFSNNAGLQTCYTVNGCQFWGEIDNKGINIPNRLYNKSNEITNLRVFDKGYGLESLIAFSPVRPGVCDNVNRTYVFQTDANHGYYYCNSSITGDPFNFNDIKNAAEHDHKLWCLGTGFDLRIMVFKLSDGKWYVTPMHNSYACGYDPNFYSTLPENSIFDIEYVPGHQGEYNYVTKFKLKLPVGLKLEAVSDLESATKLVLGHNACNSDNIFDQKFKVWLAGEADHKIEIVKHAIGVATAGAIDLSNLSDNIYTYNNVLNICLYHNRGIHSTCRMNGGVGWFTRGEGISSIKAGGVIYNYAIIDANGSIDWDVNATQAGHDSISEGFNIGLMALKLSDGNWYVAKDFKDKNGNPIDRKLPGFIKKLDNSFYKISNVVQLPDGNTTVAVLDCNYNGHQLDPSLCGLKVKIIMPQGNMKIVKIRDIQSLLNFKEPIYGNDSNQTYWYKNNEYNLTIKFPLANNNVVTYRGEGRRMSAINVPDLATAQSQINIFGGADITGDNSGYLSTINSIESEKNRGKIPVLRDKLYFWDSFIDGFLGEIQFIREVRESDRKEGFVPEDIIPYYMLDKGFVSFSDPSKKVKKTIFVNNSILSSSSECTNAANAIGGIILHYNASENIMNNLPVFTFPASTSSNLYAAAGVQDLGSPCIIEKDGLHAMEDVLAAQRKLIYTGTKQMMCSPYKCVDFECKLAECPDGFSGNNIPNSYIEGNKCILNRCDFFDPNGFVKVCGKTAPCDTTKPGVVQEGNTCKELYCPEGSLDPVKGTCIISECPNGYHEDNTGKCIRN